MSCMRLMGLDVGTKYIGVAVSDELGMIAQGRERVLRETDEKAVDRIKDIAGEYDVEKVIVGYPVNMDGSVGERARDSRDFASLIENRAGLSVELWDERLSTKEAEEAMIEGGASRRRRKDKVDKLAAQIILQGYLDRKNAGDK